MPIPPFDHNGVVPPHLGDPRDPLQLSPYWVSSLELCQNYCTSRERAEILAGWLKYRSETRAIGLTDGFQWLDGSFVEQVELLRSRAPKDLDVVTFYRETDPHFNDRWVNSHSHLLDHATVKSVYKLDHYPIDLSIPGEDLVEFTRYWSGLFAHNRDGVWKGMLCIDLNTPSEDSSASALISAYPI